MKARVSPTSPKNKKGSNSDKQLDEYYKDTLKSIEKPDKLKSRTSIGFLLVVIVIGFMAGIIGQIALLSYGSDIPYLDKLDIFSWTNQQSLFVSSRSNDKIDIDQFNKVVNDIDSSIVQIFRYQEPDNTFESLYIPDKSLGSGFVLTNDGYIVTTNDVLLSDEDKLVIITKNKEVYLINEIIFDTATNFVFLKTDATNLQTININDTNSLSLMSDIFLVKPYGFDNSVQVNQTNIIDKSFRPIAIIGDFIESSEKYESGILLSNNIPESFINSIAFTSDKEAIGIVNKKGDSFVIMPFLYIKNTILNLLETGEIKRLYLGINFVNLATTVNMPEDISKGNKKGILIYSNDEENNPSIIEGSPAYKAGLETNDIITAIDDQILNGNTFLGNIIQGFDPQDIVTFSIIRDGKEQKIKITLDEKL